MIYLLFTFLGGSLTLCIYHIFIYIGRKKDLTNLSYAILNFSLSTLLFVREIYPHLSFYNPSAQTIAEIAGLVFLAGSFSFFCHTMFQIKVLLKPNLISYIFLVLIVSVVTAYFIAHHNAPAALRSIQIIFALFAFIFIIPMTVILIKEKQYKIRRTKLTLTGVLAALVVLPLYPALKALDITLPPEFSYTAVTIMILFFSFSLADSFNREHRELEDLTNRLENKVAERTIELSKAMESIDEASKLKTTFFINLAHETKTPLTLISNYLEKYIQKTGLDDDLIIIKQNIDKLKIDMLNFLDSEKLEKGQVFYRHDEVLNLSRITVEKLPLFKEMARRKKITISADIGPDVYIKADSFAVDRILNNLLDNAVKYTPEGGKVFVTLAMDAGKILCIVRNTGNPIPQEQIDRIFEPYYQLSHEKRNIQGIGMGLNITRKVIETMNGSIRVQSSSETGTEFRVILQGYSPNPGDTIITTGVPNDTIQLTTGTSKEYKTKPRTSPVTLLVVEDNPDLLSFLEESLSAKFNIHTARNGLEALSKIKSIEKPDLVLSDIMMDGMDGIELCRAFSENPQTHGTPFLFLSAKTSLDDKLKGLSAGAIDYINKPFSIQELTLKIDSIIHNQSMLKALLEKDKFASLGKLLGSISHEIFNPLSGIQGPVENLEKIWCSTNGNADPRIGQFIQLIYQNIERIRSIITHVKVLFQTNTVSNELLDMDKIINSTIALFQNNPQKAVKFEKKLQPGLRVRGSSAVVTHSLMNLIVNSIDAITDNGCITIQFNDTPGYPCLSVSDNGHGMDATVSAQIFDAFYTTKSLGKGSGLGLFLVKNMVTQAGWDIKVQSVINQGTEFSIMMKSTQST